MPDADVASACVRFGVPMTISLACYSNHKDYALRIEIDNFDLGDHVPDIEELEGKPLADAKLLYESARAYSGNYDGMWNFGIISSEECLLQYVDAVKAAYPDLVVLL